MRRGEGKWLDDGHKDGQDRGALQRPSTSEALTSVENSVGARKNSILTTYHFLPHI